MRFSVYEEEPGYENHRVFQPLTVRLNDKVVTHVLNADTDAGEVEVALLDLDGQFYLNESKTALATATLRGRVTVELAPQPHN